jgi:hypothetical protein
MNQTMAKCIEACENVSPDLPVDGHDALSDHGRAARGTGHFRLMRDCAEMCQTCAISC